MRKEDGYIYFIGKPIHFELAYCLYCLHLDVPEMVLTPLSLGASAIRVTG